MGRYNYSHRRVIEQSAGIRIQDLINQGLTQKPCRGIWNHNITRGHEQLADVKFTVQIINKDRLSDDNFIQFEYEYQGKSISFKQPIEIQPVYLGGYRYYFRCNCNKNGNYCGRRVKALYFGGNIWACRHCLELVYNNCRHHRDETQRARINADYLQTKADTLRRYRHPRKANRLEWRVYEYERAADEAMFHRLASLLTRIEKR